MLRMSIFTISHRTRLLALILFQATPTNQLRTRLKFLWV